MEAHKKELLDFMKKARLSVPIYQRPYSWEEKHCKKLWEDIIQAGNPDRKSPHFIGSILSVPKSLVAGTELTHTLIDGQQRITTLSLLLIALRDKLENIHLSLSFDANSYLITQEQGEDKYKLKLSIKEDKDTFQYLINGKKEELANSKSKIKQTFDHFTKWLKNCSEKELEAIIRGLDKLQIITIGIDSSDDDPQIIFQNLNSAGKPLSQTDLIRNHILMSEEEKRQKELYDTYWLPMEEGFGKDEARFNKFIFHYLTMEEGEVKESEVYEKFKQHMQDQNKEKLLANLKKHATHYCHITGLQPEQESSLRDAFQELGHVQAEQAYPLLLKCYDCYKDSSISFAKEDFVKIIRLTINYIFRLSICGMGTHGLGERFIELIKKINIFIASAETERQEKTFYECIDAGFASTHGQKQFPDDERFAQALQTRNIYNPKTTQYLLGKLENHGYKGSLNYKDAKYTIEHIMPQTLTPEWIKDLGDNYQQVHETYRHTLGNLTLVDENAKLSNKPFEEKRDGDKGYKDNRIITLNKDIINQDKWGEAQIKARAENLAKMALEIWTKPQAPLQTTTAYTIEHHFADKNSQPLYEQIKQQVAQWGEVSEKFNQYSITLKLGSKEILSVVPWKDYLNLFFRANITKLDDPKGKVEDMTHKGHWGNGNTKIKLESPEDIPYCMELIKQALAQREIPK